MTIAQLRAQLRAERAALIRDQYALAARINSYYPRPTGQDRPLGEKAACQRAEENVARIREIDADLGALA
jgi:hypothetical protein